MDNDPEAIINEIRLIQQELVEQQHKVIQGALKPDEYKRIEEDRVKKIHALEKKMAALTGQAEPERETELE